MAAAFALTVIALTGSLLAQDAQFGVAMPLTLTGGVIDTGRAYADNPAAANVTAGFRLLAYPELKLGSHWYVYSAVEARSTPFFYEDAYSADRNIDVGLLQGFVGYSRAWKKVSIGVRAGKLVSAFGFFPLRYDDMANPLLDQPLAYTYLKLPFDGAVTSEYGNSPVTLYGLPGIEFDVSWRRVDARVQLTNSSPANPRGLFASNQHAQWTAGAGFTIRQGFRVGMSAYRGPWLDSSASPYSAAGTNLAHYPAVGWGVDVQWARGHWSARAEWDRFAFDYPGYTVPPVSNFGYVELKRTISSRWYAAIRANTQSNNRAIRWGWQSPTTFLPDQQTYEFAVGFRPDRRQLLKVGYEAMDVHDGLVAHDNVFGIQFVTTIDSLSKAFK